MRKLDWSILFKYFLKINITAISIGFVIPDGLGSVASLFGRWDEIDVLQVFYIFFFPE